MKAVHVLGRIDAPDHGVWIDLLRQRHLDEDAMNAAIGVESIHDGQQLRPCFTAFGQLPRFGEVAPVPGVGLALVLEGGVGHQWFRPEPARPGGGQPVLLHRDSCEGAGVVSQNE